MLIGATSLPVNLALSFERIQRFQALFIEARSRMSRTTLMSESPRESGGGEGSRGEGDDEEANDDEEDGVPLLLRKP